MNKCSCGFKIGHPEFSKCICNITKPLSDEVIKEVIRKHWNREYGNRNMLALCRAIEERHGIK